MVVVKTYKEKTGIQLGAYFCLLITLFPYYIFSIHMLIYGLHAYSCNMIGLVEQHDRASYSFNLGRTSLRQRKGVKLRLKQRSKDASKAGVAKS